MDLLEKFKNYIKKENLFQPRDRLLLAVSGGADSVALCKLCKDAGYNFIIAHCNFQLRGAESRRDEDFVRALALDYGVPFYLKIFDTKGYAKLSKKSIEEAARDLRYEWFYTFVNSPEVNKNETTAADTKNCKVDYILTGHHADDNIETVLMNFFRGTGISGLRGMQSKQGKIIRPLLFCRREELEVFLKLNGLGYVTDHTNFENDYTRNYFRNRIIPLVNESYPEATRNILKNIQRFREIEMLYLQSIGLHKKKMLMYKGEEVHIPVLKLVKAVPQSTLVYEIIKDFGFTAHQVPEVIDLLKSLTGKYIRSATHRIIRNRNWLIISPNAAIEQNYILIGENDTSIEFIRGVITLQNKVVPTSALPDSIMTAMLDNSQVKFPLLLRKWKQGDYFYPLGMQKKKKLSRFFIDQKLSLTQKENVWVIEMDKKILWVIGMRIDDRFKVTNSTQEILRFIYLPK